MRTMGIEKPRFSSPVPKQDQVFTENSNFFWNCGDVFR